MSEATRSHHNVGLDTGSVVNDRYEILGLLGSGGFAVVFKAFDRVIEREVAMKVLNMPALGHSDDQIQILLKRFQREARLAAKIRHPSVVQIFDLGVLDTGHHPFIIMDLLEGHDLEAELRKNGPWTPCGPCRSFATLWRPSARPMPWPSFTRI
ncbi:MAG: protein kinase domain-containing protein [Bradymonadaceae bacterium]